MARNITITFEDGSSHIYENAPDDATPEQATQRAEAEFGRKVVHLDGGAAGAPEAAQAVEQAAAPSMASLIPGQDRAGPPMQKPSGSILDNVGRTLASFMDTTVGGILPAVAQVGGYGVARLAHSPEQAQAIAGQMASAVDKPFGKAFGVENTPEYQGEASRQVMDFIGQNFQKGAKWISEKTGLPQADVESYMGTASFMLPKVVAPVAKAAKEFAGSTLEKATTAAKMPFEKQLNERAQRQSLQDYERGPQIEAAADAQRLKIALNPADIDPSMGPKMTSIIAGEQGEQLIGKANIRAVRRIALNEMDMPPTTQLNGGAAFEATRSKLAGPYNEVAQLPVMMADDTVVSRLNALRPDENVIGKEPFAKGINKRIDIAIAKTSQGQTGAQVLESIKVLREQAKKTYNNQSAGNAALEVADTNLAIAGALEEMLEANVKNPKLVEKFRESRQKMARSYAYEGATNKATGVIDVSKLARIASKDSALTGDIASLGKIGANFPEVFTNKVSTDRGTAARYTRSGAMGVIGAVAGQELGLPWGTGAAVGGLIGLAGGELGQGLAARRVASRGYQEGLNLRDMRLPVNQMAATQAGAPATVPSTSPQIAPMTIFRELQADIVSGKIPRPKSEAEMRAMISMYMERRQAGAQQ